MAITYCDLIHMRVVYDTIPVRPGRHACNLISCSHPSSTAVNYYCCIERWTIPLDYIPLLVSLRKRVCGMLLHALTEED